MLSFRRQKEDSPTRNERHVLMLPGLTKEELEPHCKCETLCWARFLPPGVPLSRMSHDLLLDRFFFFYSSWCLRIIPAYFLRDMYRYLHDNSPSSPPRTAHYSPFLHLAVLAVATAFSDDPVIASGDARKSFADLAKSQLEKELGTPSLSAVQGLSMLGSFHSGLGEQTLGFVYFVGLGADYAQLVQKGKMKPRDLFDRYWAFHMECAQDACWALYVGRDFGIPVSQNEPYTLAELADPILDRMSWRKSGVQPQISRKIMAIMRVISKARNGNELKLEVADIDEQLINWQEDLPDTLKVNTSSSGRHTALPHVLMMHCSLWWLMVLLHGPFYRRRKASALDNSFNISRCRLAAKEILALVCIWRDLYGTIRFAPITLIQVVFAAGTVHLLSAHQALLPCNTRLATTAHANALARVEESIMALDELGQSWPHARKIADSFRKLGDAQRQRMAMRISVSGKADGPLGDKQSREARSEGYLPSEGMLATTAPSLERPAVFELTSYDTPISTSTSTQSRPLPGTFGNDNSLESSENEFDFASYALSSETLDSGLFPGIQIDESSVFDYMGSGWSMADGGSLPDQPFAVGLGDSFGTIPAEWSEVMDSTAYSTDFGAGILYEITSMDLHELEDF
ncbi:hypothetical protein DFH11DRAFT_1807557 [Phellopilus nigrolimitatus]|nr:hypothetical protein DFH11DRAFT_1807557 [Phellopilus nigrolimitatus]